MTNKNNLDELIEELSEQIDINKSAGYDEDDNKVMQKAITKLQQLKDLAGTYQRMQERLEELESLLLTKYIARESKVVKNIKDAIGLYEKDGQIFTVGYSE